MPLPSYLRARRGGSLLGVSVLCAAAAATSLPAQSAQPPQAAAQGQTQQAPAASSLDDTSRSNKGAAVADSGSPSSAHRPGQRQLRAAEEAYLAGARKLNRDDLVGAEKDFRRALKLDPDNRSYAVAISVAREHHLTQLVQQSTKVRQAGDPAKADALLAEARAIDPADPIVLEHSEPVLANNARASQPGPSSKATPATDGQLTDSARLIAATQYREPWKIDAPVIAGAIHLTPSNAMKSFTLRGSSRDVLRNVASAYGIRAVIDDSVDQRAVRFELDNVTYEQAMAALMQVTHVFAVPLDETSVLIAKDDAANRRQMERQLQETIEIPGSTPEQLNELANVVRTIFGVSQATTQPAGGTMVIRAPQDVLEPLNRTLQGLVESSGEVMIEVKLYEIDTSRMVNIGTTIPTQFSAFNVQQEAASIVTSNQSLVQQAIAQGYISATASNLEIALALIGSGLVQSTLASNLIGTIGGGLVQTGISASTNTTFNLSLNTSDTRSLDDVQMRVEDHQPAVFREGTRYPVTSSTYTTGLSTAASSLSNASINGVSVANLLSQYAGGTSATIPQVTYEDLGVTLKATPVIQRSGRINLLLDLKIEALAGGSLNGIPVLANRQFASDITVVDGESALLVSNVTKNESAAMTGIPGLSELPGFQLPTDRNTETDTSQLVVVVTPHIVRRRANRIAGPRMVLHSPTQQ